MNSSDLRENLKSMILNYLARFDDMTDEEGGILRGEMLDISPDPMIIDYIEELDCFDGEKIVPPLDEIDGLLNRVLSHRPDVIYL